ncbi:unnamed protein product [Parnassius mnemosyne]|uniref:Uncharacterized protein n=1 Tax=Parnassius mnemosyne TaxID=213953 RepID=A0AAV1KYV7_9NEOP
MKRRVDYILEKVNFNSKNQVIPETNNKSLTDSPSIIENSPHRSIPYFDPKVLCVADTNKLQTKIQIQEFTIVLEPELNNCE